MKRKVYIETTVVSYLTARDSEHIYVLSKQHETRRWWSKKRERFDVFASELVVQEAGKGNLVFAKERLDLLATLPMLSASSEAASLAALLVEGKAVPQNATDDAGHIAIATVHGMDFLLTWNFRHINNALKKNHIKAICRAEGYTAPEICTPEELMVNIDVI